MAKYDFSGWATRNNLKCSDGRTIMKDAFKECDGQTVPLVWNHQHNDPFNVLGHALLKNMNDGVYAYCTLNDTESGKHAKLLIEHGDVRALSIWANNLRETGGNVLHGAIREVSLVLAGANPGAFIESVLSHGEESSEEAIIYTGMDVELYHADTKEQDDEEDKGDDEPKGGKSTMNTEDTKKKSESEETIADVFDTLSEKQKNVVYAMIGMALEESKGKDDEDDNSEGGNSTMKHNVFDSESQGETYLSHSDMATIFADAKRIGSLRDAVLAHQEEEGGLLHGIDTTGMTTATGSQQYGFNDPDMLFPDYKTLNNVPEWIKRDTDWVATVMNGVHHTPFSRIKSVYANITEDEARAKGYIKGKQKKEEVFTTLKRTTDPQTVYKKQKLDRDDIVDITDFDVVAWIKAEMRVMLDEEIARAILIGDGRPSDSDDKIQATHIRPIATDVPLFNTTTEISGYGADGWAKTFIDGVIRARKNYKGSGNPTLFTTEDVLTECLLLEDQIGHKLYKSAAELATALRVSTIVTVEAMEGQKINDKSLIGIIVNLADYNVGADKGGAVSLFDDFDIDYNQQKYLIETRVSGALIKPYSALTFVGASE